jgi:hypothetical protein
VVWRSEGRGNQIDGYGDASETDDAARGDYRPADAPVWNLPCLHLLGYLG